MKKLLIAVVLMFGTSHVFADDHAQNLSFEPRQIAHRTITSINLTKGGGVITATGNMGKYGRVYTTYTLTADADGLQGTVLGEGRGALQDGTLASGSGTGCSIETGRASRCTSFSKSMMAHKI